MNSIITKFISESLNSLLLQKMKKLILFLFLVSLNTFGQYATKHYIAPAPWNYSSSANEFIVSTVTSGTVSVTVTKSDGTAITTMNVTPGTPAVYRPSNATNPVSAFPANAVNTVYNDRGLIFTSASPIAVSIRNVESDSYSSGIPSFMKGNAALASYGNEGSGTSFRVGYYRSVFTGLVAQGTGATAAPVYSVMAINNNTVVSKNGTALVILQAGQSYLFQTPIGDLITSTKPVVMNSGSWQDAPGGCGDGVFDQIPPLRVLGKNYFVVRGSGTAGTGTNLPEQTLFIATENNTTVTATTYNVAGTATGTTTYTLATAGSYQNIFHGDASTAYTATSLSANKNIVVYSGTAQSCEVDMSALPPISACAGSFKVETKRFLAFDNTTVLPYFGYVLINSPTAIVNINGANLETLGGVRRQLGTSGYYLIDFTNTQLGDPTNLVFTSTVRMSVSMVQQGGGYSMSAYLSSFNDTLTPVDSTINGAGCITLLTAEPGFSPYQWYYNGVLIPGATSQTYRPTGTGNYSVSGTRTCGLTVASTDFVVNCVPIDAIDDGTAILPFATVVAGTTLSTSVKANDLLDNILVTNSNTNVIPSTQGPLTIDSLGMITVASGTPNGVYAIQYQLCSTLLFPTVCDLATAYVKVAVLPGSIDASQSICSGGNPAIFTSVSPGVGASTVTSYRWESSVSPFTTWNTIAGANTATYDAPAGLTVTTQYRRIAITSLGESDPTTSVTVTIQAPTLSGVVVNTTCGSSNGTITITSNATSFLWSDGVTTKNRTALPAGNYSVTATDASGCTATASFVVNSSGVPRITGTVSNVNCFGQNTGAIATVMVITGTRTYTYAWTGPSSFTATTASINSLSAGTYNLTVTDNNGCKGFYSANVTQPIAALSASSTKNDVSCLGGADGAVNLIVSGGNGPYSYEWTGPNSFTATSEDLSSIAAGTYNVTVADAKGCTTTATAIVGTPAALAANLSSNSPVCSGSNAVFTITGTAGNTVTYTGASSGTATIGSGGTATVTITGVTTSTTLNLTNVSNGTCNQALAATATVNINPLPAVPTVAVTAPTCASAATNILSTYSASLTYTSTPAGLSVDAGGVITGGTNGTSYTITATNASLCSATTASFTYNGGAILPTPAVPTVVVTAPTCASAATNILSTYSASLTYTSAPAGLSVNAGGVITGGTNGTSYTITATNASLCSATTASFTYNGGAILPTPAIPTVVVTAPTCASAATNILSTYSASLTYTSTPAGLSVDAGGVITGGTNGTSYTITATNASLCSATTASFTFDGGAILPTPVVFSVTGGGEVCIGGTGVPVGLSNSNVGINYQLQFNGINNGAAIAGTGSAISFGNKTAVGTYTVIATNATTTCTTAMTGSTNITFCLLGSIESSVWYDANGDGVQGSGENGLVGATITLDPGTPGNPADDITTTTDASGNYLFSNLPAGNYTVSVNVATVTAGLPAGVTASELAQTYDADGTGTANKSTIALAAGENNTDQDFGYKGIGSIAATVWYDANGDGTQGAGENGLAGATVTLDPGTPGNPADDITTTTDASGNYLFSNLPAGNYTVSVNVATVTAGLPAGVTASELAQTYDADGTGTANKSTIALAAGENNTDQDFGYRASAGSIAATVWYDTNGDGIKGAGENGLAGATVTLDPGTPGNPADDITTTTDASGNYLFTNLPAGNYTVSVNYATVIAGLPAGVLASQLSQTYDADGTSTANNSTVTLAAGGTSTNQNFGYRAVGSIGDLVWYDTNGDGLKDVGENGLAGATVTLDPSTPGNPADDIITITDASGNYLFSNLVFGTYIISVNVATVTAGIPSGYNSSQLVPTFDADSSVGTPLKSTIVLSFGQNNLDQDFAFVKSSDATTGGHGGGVESESLGDAISKIYVGRKKNSEPTEFVKSSKNLFNKSKYKTLEAYKGNGQTMLDMFPKELVAGNIANETSPKDILDYTIADQVLAVDFSIGGKTKAVVLGIKTSNKVYNHTKASCDRLRGAEILNIQKVKLQGYNFLMQGIKQRNGVVEYAVSFAVAKNNNDTNYSIQTNWYVNAYKKFNDVYNFQVWSTRPADTQKLVSDILNNLKSYMPVNQTEVQKFPETYASKVYREKGELIVKLRSTKVGNTAEITMEELYSETANNIKFRDNTLSTQIKQELRVDIADGYEYDGVIKVDSKVEDAFYHADGNWGLDFDKRYTKINNYFIWNNFNRKYSNEEYSIDRNVEIKATSEYDYLTVYKTLLPGTLSADYSEYKYLAFTAKGSGLTEIGLIKSSIEDWKSQYRIMVNLTEKEQTYYIPFDAFISATSKESMTPNDLTTLMFTFLPVEAKTKELDMMISNLKFVKAAGNDGVVISKVVKFDNSFLAYPNPSKGKVNLMLFSNKDTNADIILSDLLGRTIYKSSADLKVGRNELDFNFNIPSGTYILNVTSKDTDYGTSKIIFR